MPLQDLQEENISLREENQRIDLARVTLMTKNQELAEFIRLKLKDVLSLAKELRDTYGAYAQFVVECTQAEQKNIGNINNENNNSQKGNKEDI